MNQVEIVGTITNDFTKEDIIKIGKEDLYSSFIETKRDSGISDIIPIVIDYNTSIQKGDRVRIIGNFISYNNHLNEKNKLLLFVHIKDMYITKEENDINNIKLTGFICKKKEKRKTPLGRTIIDIIVAVNTTERHSDYIPCIFWGRNANYIDEKDIGDKITIKGRCQSRVYRKIICERYQEMVAYEISVSEIE